MYTLVDTPELQKRIQHDLDVIVERIRSEYGSNLVSVLLCGGYGRGEGSVVARDGMIQPYNDYDILLVTKRRVSQSALKKLGEDLASELGIRFVDLGSVTRSRLEKLPQTVFVRDLRVSTLLWGEEVREALPFVNPANLSLEEARVLLRNRLICFFELTPLSFFNGESLNTWDHQRLVLQLSKAGIAIHLSSLIKDGKYHSSYAQQMELAGDAIIRSAYQVKLGLRDPMDIDPQHFWMAIRDRYVEMYDPLIDDSNALDIHRQSLTHGLKAVVKRVVYSETTVFGHIQRRVEFVVLNLLKAYPHQDEFKEMAQMGLRNWFEIDSGSLGWHALAQVCDALWQKYHH